MNNEHQLPDFLKTVVTKTLGQYNRGECDFSVTSLLKPPLLSSLESVHSQEIESDLSENLASFFGTCIHDKAEQYLTGDDRYISEVRYFHDFDVDGKFVRVSGKIDLFDTEDNCLWDIKCTSIFKLKGGDHSDFEAQLNMNRYLMHKVGINVEKLAIAGIPLDWRNSEAKRDEDYPKARFKRLDFEPWSLEATEDFIKMKIREHQAENPRPCTDKERWATEAVFAVHKNQNKRAVRLLNYRPTLHEVEELGGTHYEERPVEYRRCEGYCSVKSWCPVYKSLGTVPGNLED